LTIPSLEKWAKVKGVNFLGTGDFTHPTWMKELKDNLKDDGSGILKTPSGFRFALQGEISLIYSQGGKGRRVHIVMMAPSFEVADQINSYLVTKGRVDYDGRPIFGMNCMEFTEELKGISKDIEIVPAHIWTPWFSLFGSKSGFDTIEECFGDQLKHIHALETGLSSDPQMNWRLSQLDRFTLLSNSDLHSFWPWRIGREANVFELPENFTYKNFIQTIRERDPKKFLYTIEVDPSYGKYHFDGHRACGVCLEPKKATENKDICPKCGRPLTIGVLHRVEELADRPEGYKPNGAIPFKSLVPLSEIVAASLNSKLVASKKVWALYNQITEGIGSELDVLIEAPKEKLEEAGGG
jgi:uncharacterized protein (TIGR00375 family)